MRAEGLLFLYGLESNPESSLQLHRRLDSLEATQWAPRDTYRDPGGYQNPLLPLETRPDSPGEPNVVSKKTLQVRASPDMLSRIVPMIFCCYLSSVLALILYQNIKYIVIIYKNYDFSMRTLYGIYTSLDESILTDMDKTIQNGDDITEIYDFINSNYNEIALDKLIISKYKINGKYKYRVSTDAHVGVKNTKITTLVNDLFVWDTVKTFYCNNCKNLKSLEGAPKTCINFDCTFCDSLTNLIGAPEHVDTEFNCSYCKNLSSLEGIRWKSVHHFSCKGTSINLPAGEIKKIVHSKYTTADDPKYYYKTANKLTNPNPIVWW